MKSKTWKTIMWVLTVFMFLSALVFFPSVASVFMLLFCVFSVPISKVQEFWASLGLKKVLKAVLLSVIFIMSMAFAPTDDASENVVYSGGEWDGGGTLPGMTEQQDESDPEGTKDDLEEELQDIKEDPPEETPDTVTEDPPVQETPKEEPPVDEETSVQEIPTEDPVEEPVQEEPQEDSPAQEEPVEETIHGRPANTTVYVSRSGKIHTVSDCSGMTRYTEMSLSEADAKGYDYCENCW